MILQAPSNKRKKPLQGKLIFIPVLNVLLIIIFFLFTLVNLSKFSSIQNEFSIGPLSDSTPNGPSPLSIMLNIEEDELIIHSSSPSAMVTKIPNKTDGEYDLEELNQILLDLKKENLQEETLILKPNGNLDYEHLIKIMDSLRGIKFKGRESTQEKNLFNKIIFDNLMS